ncbi:putative minor capsid protein [Bacillus sp. CLL-7-23]|uniref:Minor capsid protein n=1 Tax=Bacillus changyiensis TaxID=3004103 RepID=A0ABT4XAW3_9BACI|nr:putative minor capsid protein [Bacillus changyiensis]MDA1477270.1 putative minor capsid protein [Bacillus changyiensis]MDA7028522.1 putative minor capsid protein [Bacillus changyiensis]
MARPIPERLLIHSIIYQKYLGSDDGWNGGSGSYDEPVHIEKVRVEPISTLIRNQVRDETEGESVILIDRTNSKPYMRLKERSKVTFDGQEYEVNKMKEHYDESPNMPHHYEVILK